MRITTVLFDAIQREAQATGLDPLLIAAVCLQEGGLHPYPPDGDEGMSHGPMQLHRQGAGAGYTIRQLRDVEVNVHLGAAYLREKVNLYPGDLGRALTAYNWPAHAAAADYAGPTSYGLAVLGALVILQDDGIERDPAGGPDPTDLELIDALWGFLGDAATGRLKARVAARDAGRAHLLMLKERILP